MLVDLANGLREAHGVRFSVAFAAHLQASHHGKRKAYISKETTERELECAAVASAIQSPLLRRRISGECVNLLDKFV